jgi:hypothetical protein
VLSRCIVVFDAIMLRLYLVIVYMHCADKGSSIEHLTNVVGLQDQTTMCRA